jgi:hypothetical protein
MGPYGKLIIRGITVIDGTGAAPMGPMDVVVEHNQIVDVVNVRAPHVPIDEKRRPAKTAHEIDGTGMYLMPGFVDNHVHYGDPSKAPEAEYCNKLWLANGITTVRGVPAGPLDWALHERERSFASKSGPPKTISSGPLGEHCALAKQVSRDEQRIGGALCEPSHEVGVPLSAKRNIHANAISLFHQRVLEVASNAI